MQKVEQSQRFVNLHIAVGSRRTWLTNKGNEHPCSSVFICDMTSWSYWTIELLFWIHAFCLPSVFIKKSTQEIVWSWTEGEWITLSKGPGFVRRSLQKLYVLCHWLYAAAVFCEGHDFINSKQRIKCSAQHHMHDRILMDNIQGRRLETQNVLHNNN